jgi:hypothetical protein
MVTTEKHVSDTTQICTTVKEPFRVVISIRFSRSYTRRAIGQLVNQRVRYFLVEAGSNTSTVTLRVVGGDEKESLESETVKYGHESHGTRTQN